MTNGDVSKAITLRASSQSFCSLKLTQDAMLHAAAPPEDADGAMQEGAEEEERGEDDAEVGSDRSSNSFPYLPYNIYIYL